MGSIDKTDKSGYNIIKGVDIMSTREIAYNIIDCMSEVKDMKLHPENYKSYDDVDVMFKELLA